MSIEKRIAQQAWEAKERFTTMNLTQSHIVNTWVTKPQVRTWLEDYATLIYSGQEVSPFHTPEFQLLMFMYERSNFITTTDQIDKRFPEITQLFLDPNKMARKCTTYEVLGNLLIAGVVESVDNSRTFYLSPVFTAILQAVRHADEPA